ncbi:hypothetical protein INT47_007232 [Mucor saturninus]|uniref:Uncharacterized protein n=1 Tax=Mucor saturninus TaxID=64648 RepID=A0A8H7QHF4_9FUNG|nr:hypothetical protein INT47_007232 [Mucor saturninus]
MPGQNIIKKKTHGSRPLKEETASYDTANLLENVMDVLDKHKNYRLFMVIMDNYRICQSTVM